MQHKGNLIKLAIEKSQNALKSAQLNISKHQNIHV